MIFLFLFLIIAVVQDFKALRVSNRLILMGIVVAIFYRLISSGWKSALCMIPNLIFPVIVLYLIYLAGAIGAADVKLFSLVGCYFNFEELVMCMITAFIWGALMSVVILLKDGNTVEKLSASAQYIMDMVRGDFKSYPNSKESSKIHFSFEILCGVITVLIYELLLGKEVSLL